ncbi:MAG: prolyl-tRNA synthetase associated domain-containing protein [Pyramidobacter sp.]|jgi:Ala-tRNA(Pro) deacylase
MNKQEVFDMLDTKKIAYEKVEHAPVFTIDEMLALHLPHVNAIAKNLFVRDDKKRQYCLITVKEEKRVDLKEFRNRFNTRRLTFASEEDLAAILGLSRGAVTPFGILNDTACRVIVYFDEDFRGKLMGIHPNENTATVYIKTEDVARLIEEHGNELHFARF